MENTDCETCSDLTKKLTRANKHVKELEDAMVHEVGARMDAELNAKVANERIAQLEALAESQRLEIIYLKAERDGATLALANRVERDAHNHLEEVVSGDMRF